MIATAIQAAIQAAQEATGVVEIKLDAPTHEAHEAIVGNGGTFVRDEYTVWCRSDTCAHNSHDAGQDFSVYEVPASWVEEAKDPAVERVFACSNDTSEYSYRVCLVIPSLPPVAIEEGGERHYANRSRLIPLTRPL